MDKDLTTKEGLLEYLKIVETAGMTRTGDWASMWQTSIRYYFSDQLEGHKTHKDWDWVVVNYIWPAAMDTLYTDPAIPDPPLSDPAFFDALPPFLSDPEINLNRFRWFWRFDTPDKAERMTTGYFRMISGVDAVLGLIRDELEQLGLADNTLLILMGDNGYFLGERGYAGKWLPYEPSIRVPLLVFDPRPGSFRGGWAGDRADRAGSHLRFWP